MPGSHLIADDVAAWRWVILSFVCALARCVLLATEMLSEAWLHHRVQLSHAGSLDWVEASDVC